MFKFRNEALCLRLAMNMLLSVWTSNHPPNRRWGAVRVRKLALLTLTLSVSVQVHGVVAEPISAAVTSNGQGVQLAISEAAHVRSGNHEAMCSSELETVFQDRLSSGGRGPEMTVVPGGRFRMGCLSDDASCEATEKPIHFVEILEPFAISKHEVTLAQWDKCVLAGGCNGIYLIDYGWGRTRRPVIVVSWEEAQLYVAWLTRESGAVYRLPSESEWEYAARSRTETKWSFGADKSRLCRYANHRDSSTDYKRSNETCSDGYGSQTAPIGHYEANGFGLHDIHGNVAEWVEDCWNDSYEGAPNDGSAWRTGDCKSRVQRGGNWYAGPEGVRSARRVRGVTSKIYFGVGFRVARSLSCETQGSSP